MDTEEDVSVESSVVRSTLSRKRRNLSTPRMTNRLSASEDGLVSKVFVTSFTRKGKGHRNDNNCSAVSKLFLKSLEPV